MNTTLDLTTTSSQDNAGKPTHVPLPGHLVGLPGGEWSVWRWFCLRGAGFPLSMVQDLASPTAAAAADDVLRAQNRSEELKRSLANSIRNELDVVRDGEKRKQLARMLTHLNKGRTPEPGEGPVEQAQTAFCAAHSSLAEAMQLFQHAFQAGTAAVSERLTKIASDAKFRRAVLLQNRKALHLGIDLLLRHGAENKKRGKKERQQQELVANYVQRYCVKNDSIGFFGPIGWAHFVPKGESIVAHPGPSLVSKSTIYFENWCLEALAEKIGEDESFRPWMQPRQLPLYYLNGNQLYHPGSAAELLSPGQAVVLQRVNGQRTARQIALELIRIPGSGMRTEADVYRLLLDFVKQGVIRWKFELPFLLYPEQRLRTMLERVEDEGLRAAALQSLTELEQAREQVSCSLEDPEQLDQALGGLDETFTRLTGKSPSRSGGAMYAARTLVYQDCLRDIHVEVGPQITEQLGPPLSLVLSSARWFTWKAAALYRQAFLRIYAELARTKGTATVDFLSFWLRAQPLLTDPATRLMNQILPEYQRCWDEILRRPEGQWQLDYNSKELKPTVDRFFTVPRAGWQLARHHSPDVMVAASSVEAIRRGDFFLVLGELHMAINTVRGSFAMSQHPHPEQMFASLKSDFPEPHVLPVPPKSWPSVTMRTSYTLVSPYDYYLESAEDSLSSGPRSQTLPISSLVVEHSRGGLLVRSRDGGLVSDIIEAFGEVLSSESVDYAKIARPARHQPRITIDRLVICRESWSFTAEEMAFALVEEESERFLQARRWRQEHNLPRYVFVRVPVEVKPCYLDFDSPLYVEILSKMVRRVLASEQPKQAITISEMLPTPDQIWLPDAAGRRYTCEFRTIVFDLVK